MVRKKVPQPATGTAVAERAPQIGDAVVIRSQMCSAVMTIVDIVDFFTARCLWFDNESKVHELTVHVFSLRVVKRRDE